MIEITKLKEIDRGRFKNLFESLDITEACFKCATFRQDVPKENRYRCAVTGTCIGETLNPSLVSYINWKMDWITEEQHSKNCGVHV